MPVGTWVRVVEGSPHAINPTITTQGHFVLASRDQDDGSVELNDRHLRSQGKIGDCEHSATPQMYIHTTLEIPS